MPPRCASHSAAPHHPRRGGEHAGRRVWHQGKAALTVGEEVADALEASARRSRIRAAHATAVTEQRMAAFPAGQLGLHPHSPPATVTVQG
jgi:hypothetical protein